MAGGCASMKGGRSRFRSAVAPASGVSVPDAALHHSIKDGKLRYEVHLHCVRNTSAVGF